MGPEKAPTAPSEALRLPHVAETDSRDLRIPPLGPDLDTMAGDRIERPQVHDVMAGLEIDPVDLVRDGEPSQPVAEPLRALVKSDDRQIGADGQKSELRPA